MLLLDASDDEAAMRAQVRRLLALNAGTVRYLAARLARRGALAGDEVDAIVRGRRQSPAPVTISTEP